MAPEIADSDGESAIVEDCPIDEQSDRRTPSNAFPTSPEQVSPLEIDFDEFIDPTQALSDQLSLQNGVSGPGTGSTEKMLRGLANAQRNLAESSSRNSSDKRTRSLSEHELLTIEDAPGKAKRIRTYCSNSTNGPTIDLYAEATTDSQPHMAFPNTNEPSISEGRQTDPLVEYDEQTPAQEVAMGRERDRPRRVISLLGQHMNTSKHQVSTNVSSYGGYQSIELNFRRTPEGLDINANPFAGLSQASADSNDDTSVQGDVQKEMMTSSGQRLTDEKTTDSINPAMLMQDEPVETVLSIERPSKRRKTDSVARCSTASPAPTSRRAVSVSAESISNISDKSKRGKRGRKVNSSKLANSSQSEGMAPPDLPEVPPSRRSRRSTLDSSQVSHDDTLSNTKRKRKKTKTESKVGEDLPTKNPSSELHLDDEKVIGLPKENYKPRPSRRRSRQVVEGKEQQQDLGATLPETVEDPDPNAAQNSPARESTSAIHLNDEQIISLPKDNYDPRLSRRRSRLMVRDEPGEPDRTGPFPDISKDLPLSPEISRDTANLEDTADGRPAGPSPSHLKTAKKSKKSKVKRAKTSAAALLKKSSQMLSDGEDDVLWLDSKPAAVKLDLPPDLKALKKEGEAIQDAATEASTLRKKFKTTISVEIPLSMNDKTLPAKDLEAAEKKRGRPTKSLLDLPPRGIAVDKAPTPEPLTDVEGVAAEDDKDEDEEEEEDDDTRPSRRARPPLAAKDPNAIEAPAISSEKVSTVASANKENATPQLSPAKARAEPSTSGTPSPTKGPTSHSPIQPASAWNSKSKYRVGLSKRQSIPSLLRKVDKTKAAPTKVGVKVKERKIKNTNEDVDEDDAEGGDGRGRAGGDGVLRDKDGNLVEWEF